MSDLICSATGQRHPDDSAAWRSAAGAPLDLDFAGRYQPESLAGRPATMWRYREALPVVDDADIVTLGEGCTPLVPLSLDGLGVHAKLEFLQPTGSYKDRGSSLLLSHLKRCGATHVIDDSSGNAGASIACYAARAGIACDIYVPADNAPGKLLQIEMYGARLQRVPGGREDSTTACQQSVRGATRYASHVWNPYFTHGCKTFLYEIFEQRGGTLPDALVFPVGNGALLLGSYLALRELEAGGQTDRLPRLIAVQAANCAPLAAAFAGRDVDGFSDTAAEGIAVRRPARAGQVVDAIRATGGAVWTVTEEQIRAATLLAAGMGLLIEPTSATTIAAVRQRRPAGDTVLALTGNGLKAASKLAAWRTNT